MVNIKVRDKEIQFESYSEKSHLKTDNLIQLNNLKIDTSEKLTKWYYNGVQEKGTKYLQAICIQCKKGLFSITTTRLVSEIKGIRDDCMFICRSCSCKQNAEKVDMQKRAKKRKENWDRKTEEEKNEFSSAVSRGRLRHANVTDAKIKHAIYAYTVEKRPLSNIRDILGTAGKQAAAKILKSQGVKLRNFSEAKSIYFQKYPHLNPAKSPEARAKISKWLKENPKEVSGKPSEEEREFYNKLIGDKEQHPSLGNKRYDVKLDKAYIEFDGIYWHGKMGNSYSIIQIKSILNDEEKNQLIINNGLSLYRVWSDEEFKEYTLDEIKEKAYYIIEEGVIKRDEREFFDTIVTSEYMKNIYEKYPEDIENNLRLIASFIQSFYNFPYAESNEELDDIVSKIQNNKMQKLTSNTTVGNDFLKSRFHSFYNAKKNKSESVYSGFYNIDTLSKIIGNRLGITYKESWDLTLPVIRKGFMSNYYGVSFFSPVVAYKIYNMIAKPSDTILDMSAGFGGRLLGWRAFQENGKYIGYEPNKETFNELLNFSNELSSNIELQNLPFEDVIEHKADVAFSCPPYFSTEIYSEAENQSCIRYNTFESWMWWLRDCIDKMKERADRVYLVVNERIKNNLDCEICDVIKNKGSHFTKKENYEYLIKL